MNERLSLLINNTIQFLVQNHLRQFGFNLQHREKEEEHTSSLDCFIMFAI